MALLLRPWSILVARAPAIPAPAPVVEPKAEALMAGGMGEAGGGPEPLPRRLADGRIGEPATR